MMIKPTEYELFIRLECVNDRSSKAYEIFVVVENGLFHVRSWHGRIGAVTTLGKTYSNLTSREKAIKAARSLEAQKLSRGYVVASIHEMPSVAPIDRPPRALSWCDVTVIAEDETSMFERLPDGELVRVTHWSDLEGHKQADKLLAILDANSLGQMSLDVIIQPSDSICIADIHADQQGRALPILDGFKTACRLEALHRNLKIDPAMTVTIPAVAFSPRDKKAMITDLKAGEKIVVRSLSKATPPLVFTAPSTIDQAA